MSGTNRLHETCQANTSERQQAINYEPSRTSEQIVLHLYATLLQFKVAARSNGMLRMRSRNSRRTHRNKEFSLFSLDVDSARTTTGVEDGPIFPKLYLQLKSEPIATSSSVGRSTLQTHPRLSSRLADA
jgi:hypothetical protein